MIVKEDKGQFYSREKLNCGTDQVTVIQRAANKAKRSSQATEDSCNADRRIYVDSMDMNSPNINLVSDLTPILIFASFRI